MIPGRRKEHSEDSAFFRQAGHVTPGGHPGPRCFSDRRLDVPVGFCIMRTGIDLTGIKNDRAVCPAGAAHRRILPDLIIIAGDA